MKAKIKDIPGAPTPFEPEGFTYLDSNMGEAMLIQKGELTGWLAIKCPAGNWHLLRVATLKDLESISMRIAVGN
jgi:hypothetical protein